MKKVFLLIMVLAIAVGIYEQSQDQPNVFKLIAAMVLLMFGLMKLSEKIPSKDSENDNTDQDDTQ
jgi:threonine/homoserine/homoserine lactone efflux protein